MIKNDLTLILAVGFTLLGLLVRSVSAADGSANEKALVKADTSDLETLIGEFYPPKGGLGEIYPDNCAVCHGTQLEGGAQGPALKGRRFTHGGSVEDIYRSIAKGIADTDMPAWYPQLSMNQIQQLAIYISEKRLDLRETEIEKVLIPEDTIQSDVLSFRIERVSEDLSAAVFSIEPLPNGDILLTEKTRGLSIISRDGKQSEVISGTPVTSDATVNLGDSGVLAGVGWLLDVAVHPAYESNGWIYLHYTDHCSDCNEASRLSGAAVSMNTLVRGRIKDRAWVDQEILWRSPIDTYSTVTDAFAGGRITFDNEGHVFISVGAMGAKSYVGIQDLELPYGKIHRLNEDGQIPLDNPYTNTVGAIKTIWTLGHRVPQGLEFDVLSERLWSSEHGPRGGDEINLLSPAQNYGWPLTSKGLNYDGTPVDYGNVLGIEISEKILTPPIVDFTPSVGLSSLTVYNGTAFRQWQGNLLVGSLKANSLYRLVITEDGALKHKELLLKDLARIRDIEVGSKGEILLLLEHTSGSQIVRLVPD